MSKTSGLIPELNRGSDDHRFIMDLAVDHEFLFMPQILAKYRVHNTNISSKYMLGWAKDKIMIRKYFLQRYGGKMSV